MARLLDIIFHLFTRIGLLYITLLRKKNPQQKTIAALPYYSKNWPGGHERIGNWKPFFEKEGYQYDVFWASDDKEFLQLEDFNKPLQRYLIFYKILWRRIRLLSKLNDYSAIWIQRSFIPFYPYNEAYFEKALSKIHDNITIDFYDADYTKNYNLVTNAAKHLNKVSVATPFLHDFFLKINPNTHHLRMTVNDSLYPIKQSYTTTNPIKIGWMGSPENAKHVAKIEETLLSIEQRHEVKFHIVCRDFPPTSLKHLETSKWGDQGFDYTEWMRSIDIGIVPYIGETDELKAKPAMKTLEFMACGIPVVASIWGAFDSMKHEHDYYLAEKMEDWVSMLEKLISSEKERERLGKNGLQTFRAYHSYEHTYKILAEILSNEVGEA